ncbi:MAG TPA: 4-alpha-glucanotransferase, partial [Methylomirabilota bacterium]|nr:4-alpha-glucanotransferase [Methylomirabilota bacterium]
MDELGLRWGVVPEYFGYTGKRVIASDDAVAAVLKSLGATRPNPPRAKPPDPPEGPCAPAPDRAWGWAVQLYALRSKDSWGVGDFGDLRRFGRWARRQGASVLLLNPLGAQTPTLPYQPSPYYSSSRRFLNAAYIRIEDVPGAERCAADLEPLRAAAQALNTNRLIDYNRVFELKSKALKLIFRAAPKPRGLVGWASGEGDALLDFAGFNALAETMGPAWRGWPEGLRDPDGDEVARGRAQLQE